MPAPNPFIFSGPVPTSQFAGRGKALRQVIDRLSNQARESTSIVAADRMGRTSFLRYLISDELRAKQPELQPFVPIFYDGQQAGHLDSQAIWKRILQLGKRAYFDDTLDNEFDTAIKLAENGALTVDVLEDLFDKLAAKGHLLLVAIDDFHYLMSNTKLKPPVPFFETLRSLMLRQPHALVLVVASPRPLLDLWKLGPGGSPFYNIFASVILERFTDEEVDVLLDTWLVGTGVTFTDNDKQLIKKCSGNHPLLVQYAAYLLYNCYISAVANKISAVDRGIKDPNGPAVMLSRHLLRQLQLKVNERTALDTLRNSPENLTRGQRSLLLYLDKLGALPPGVNVK
jgi:GGDEF domain-containing protein